MFNFFLRIKTFIFSVLAITVAGISSCSKSPDVRIVLCQDMTKKMLNIENTEFKWIDTKVLAQQYNGVEIILQYQHGSNTGNSACHYEFETTVDVEMGDELIDPLSIYSSYPEYLKLDGTFIKGKQLTKLVNQVMLMQGKNLLKKIEDNTKKIAEKLND